jgi:hypothetical protein
VRAATSVEEEEAVEETVDPVELLEEIERATTGRISHADFVPIAAARVLEPFVRTRARGSFRLRASPFCGFVAACARPPGADITAEPVSLARLVNLDRLFHELAPLSRRVEREGLGVWSAKLVKGAVEKCLRPDAKFAELSLFFGDQGAQILEQFLASLQFFVVHNNMDVAAIDAARRCQCAVMNVAIGVGRAEQNASCLGCL